MTRRQKVWLSLTTAASVLLCVSWFCWWWLSSGAATVTMAATTQGGLEELVSLGEPASVRVEHSFNDGQQRPLNQPGGLQLRYATRVVTQGKESGLEFEVTNQSPVVANIGFFLTDRSVVLRPGRQHRMVAVVENATTTDMRASMGLGFHLYGDRGYLGELAQSSGRVAWHLPAAQTLEAELSGLSGPEGSGAPKSTAIAPRVAVINIQPGTTVKAGFRWQAMRILPAVSDLPVLVERLVTPQATVSESGVYHLTVRGVASLSVSEEDEEVLTLKGSEGQWSIRRAAGRWVGRGEVASSWDWRLPAETKPGVYEVLFGIRPNGNNGPWKHLRLGRGVVEQADGTLKLGKVHVVSSRGPVMRVGMSFHRYPGRSEQALGLLQLQYDFARSLAADGMSGMEWWKGVDQYEWGMVDQWAGFHARDGRGVIMVFSGSPTWASARPKEPSAMWIPGYAAPPERRYWDAYARMVEATVKRLHGQLTAVECWNEPDLMGGFTGTSTELADLCKIVSTRTKAVAPEVSVICPQAESAHGMPFVLSAKTSDGVPITQFCDYVGAHMYGAMGDDLSGRPYDEVRIHEELRRMHDFMAHFGIQKPIAVTEYGIASCAGRPMGQHKMFSSMSSEDAGTAMYQSVRAFREGGVRLLGLYSYDHEDRDPKCRPGGSFIRSTTSDMFGAQGPDKVVISRINDARKAFGP